MIQVAILPCNPKKAALHHLLSPLIKELKQLKSSGMHIIGSDDVELTVKAHLLIASGNIVGVTDLCNHSGHSSNFGCRICTIETTRLLSPKGKGYGRYFLGPNLLPKNRKIKDFKDGDPEHGLYCPTPFAELKSFSGPFFFGLDELHLIGANLGPLLWKMFNKDSNSVFRLSKKKNDTLGRCLEESIKTLPSTFTGRPIGSSYLAVDWVDIVIFIIPTIVTELLEQSRCERNAISCLLGLVEAYSITLSWEVTNEDITKVQILLDQWHIFAMEKLEHNLYTSVMHYLRHIPQALKYLGPTRAYSTRPSERIIGVYSRLIKSKSSPASNAANVMMRLSAIREY
ncbi:hypothetical protein BDC45DRAFT_414060, partial [Circinella umbellata]